MSALPPKADMDQNSCDVRFVPEADIELHRQSMEPPLKIGSSGVHKQWGAFSHNGIKRFFTILHLAHDCVRDVIFVDIADILDCLTSNDGSCGILNVAKPNIRIKAHRFRPIAKSLEAARTGIIGSECK